MCVCSLGRSRSLASVSYGFGASSLIHLGVVSTELTWFNQLSVVIVVVVVVVVLSPERWFWLLMPPSQFPPCPNETDNSIKQAVACKREEMDECMWMCACASCREFAQALSFLIARVAGAGGASRVIVAAHRMDTLFAEYFIGALEKNNNCRRGERSRNSSRIFFRSSNDGNNTW